MYQNETISEQKERLHAERLGFLKQLTQKADYVVAANNSGYYSQSEATTKALGTIKLQPSRDTLIQCCKNEFGGAKGIRQSSAQCFSNGLPPSKGALRLWKKNVGGVLYYQIQYNKTEIEINFELTPQKFAEQRLELNFDVSAKLFDVFPNQLTK